MAAVVLAQLATTYLAPTIYGTLAAGAAIESAAGLWALSQGLAGFAGSMLGSAIDNALFGSGAQSMQGPRLSDLTVQASTDGAPLPVLFGTHRLAGNVIWSTGLQEVTHTEEVGGGSGGGGTITTYTYQTDLAIALCEGEITGIRRIWADTKLIYDVSDSAGADTLIASSEHAAAIRVYTGSETQEPDPLIQAVEGAGNTPAFRGTAYVVFEDLQLADFGNRVPNFTFEVVKTGEAPIDFTNYSMRRGFVFETAGDTRGGPVMIDLDGVHFIDLNQAQDGRTRWEHWLQLMDGNAIVLLESRVLGTQMNWANNPQFIDTFSDEPGCAIRTTSTNIAYYVGYESGEFVEKVLSDIYESQFMECMAKSGKDYAYYNNYVPGIPYARQIILNSRVISEISDTVGGRPVLMFSENYIHYGRTDNGCSSSSGNFSGVARWDRRTGTLSDHYTPTFLTDGTNYPGDSIYFLDDENVIRVFGDNPTFNSDKYWLFRYGDVPVAFANDAYGYSSYYSALHASVTAGGRLLVTAGSAVSNTTDPVLLTGNGACNFTWYSLGITRGTDNLQQVASTLLARAGLLPTQYDVSSLSAHVVRGYVVARPMTTRAALEPLMTAYLFDLIEEDGKIKAVKRGGAVDAGLIDDDLGAAEQPDGTRLDLTRHNPAELPSEIAITYADQQNDYQPATQYARRLTAIQENTSAVSLPLVLTSQEAARLADILLNVAWHNGRHALAWTCTYEQARLSPADVVSLPGYGTTWQARITQADLGAPGLALFQGVPDLPALYTSYAPGADAVDLSQSLGLAGPTNLRLLDCVMLRDEDNAAGWYVAGAGYLSAWPGAVVFKSNDGGATWGEAAQIARASAATMGYATTVLGTADCRVWDKHNSVTVRLTSGTLASTTEANLLNGANAALLGAAGRWELIQFQTAVLNSDGTYTLRDLLRGRKGTDHASAGHAIYDAFVLLSASTLQEIDLSSNEIGATRHYKTVTAGRALEAVSAGTSIYTGERLECLSPVLLGGGRDASGNLTLTWVRRDRVNAGWNNNGDVPMSEAAQAYEVDIHTDATFATVQRTLAGLSSPTATYTSAQQVADFGANQTTVYVRVYQLSASVGRGHFLQGSV